MGKLLFWEFIFRWNLERFFLTILYLYCAFRPPKVILWHILFTHSYDVSGGAGYQTTNLLISGWPQPPQKYDQLVHTDMTSFYLKIIIIYWAVLLRENRSRSCEKGHCWLVVCHWFLASWAVYTLLVSCLKFCSYNFMCFRFTLKCIFHVITMQALHCDYMQVMECKDLD